MELNFGQEVLCKPLIASNLSKGVVVTIDDITLEKLALEEIKKAKVLAEESTKSKVNFWCVKREMSSREPPGSLTLRVTCQSAQTPCFPASRQCGIAHDLYSLIR